MPITHDGISCRLPPRPAALLLGLAFLGAGGWLVSGPSRIAGVALLVVGVLVLLNEVGSRRVRIISSKLLVEDEHLLTNLLIGPARNRVMWTDVKSVHLDGNRLRLETNGAPFVTAQGASPDDLKHLAAGCERALAKARAEQGAP